MSAATHFIVAGAGTIGAPVIQALVDVPGASVTVLSRSTPKNLPSGAKSASVDYDDEAGLTEAIKAAKGEVLISTLGAAALGSQVTLAKAAKAAGVKVFVPSEYGVPTKDLTTSPVAGKRQLAETIESLGLKVVRFYTGFFADFLLVPGFGWDAANGKVSYPAPGTTKHSWTTLKDVGRFIAHLVSTTPASSLPDHVYFQGDYKSFNDVTAAYEKAKGRKLEVTLVPSEPLKEKYAASGESDFLSWILLVIAGEIEGGANGGKDNKLWPEWNPTTIDEFVKTLP